MESVKYTGLKWIHRFKVTGSDLNGLLDMLRYDRCIPEDPPSGEMSLTDAIRILVRRDAGMIEPRDPDLVTVHLSRHSERRDGGPTVDRWRSFGFSVD